MRPIVRYVRQQLRLKIHPYVEDFLISHRSENVLRKWKRITGKVLDKMGLKRQEEKCCWAETTRIEHFGFIIDTQKMVLGITPRRLQKIKDVAASLLFQARRNHWMVEESLFRHVCRAAISRSLAMPLAHFYTR